MVKKWYGCLGDGLLMVKEWCGCLGDGPRMLKKWYGRLGGPPQHDKNRKPRIGPIRHPSFYRDQKNGMCKNPHKNTVWMVLRSSIRGMTSPAILFWWSSLVPEMVWVLGGWSSDVQRMLQGLGNGLPMLKKWYGCSGDAPVMLKEMV